MPGISSGSLYVGSVEKGFSIILEGSCIAEPESVANKEAAAGNFLGLPRPICLSHLPWTEGELIWYGDKGEREDLCL